MTRRDIVKSAISHKETGKVPYCIDFTPEAYEKYKPYLPEREIGNFIKGISCPWWDWYQVPKLYSEFDAPSFLPKTRGYGSYGLFEEQLKEAVETTDCYVLVYIYVSHFEKAYYTRGIENFLADLMINREFAVSLLDTIIRKNLVMLENILTYQEIDGVLLGSDWGTQESLLMSPSIWRELIAPGEMKEYELIKQAGKDVWIHSCGNIEQIMPDLIDMGVDVINPVQPEAMDIFGLKSKYGRRITFFGGISTQQTLPYGMPEEVKAEVEKIIPVMSMGGGYISAPAQHLQEDVPLENIKALLQAFRKFA